MRTLIYVCVDRNQGSVHIVVLSSPLQLCLARLYQENSVLLQMIKRNIFSFFFPRDCTYVVDYRWLGNSLVIMDALINIGITWKSLKIQISKHHMRSIKFRTPRLGPSSEWFNKDSRWFSWSQSILNIAVRAIGLFSPLPNLLTFALALWTSLLSVHVKEAKIVKSSLPFSQHKDGNGHFWL